VCRERIETGNAATVTRKNKNSCKLSLLILSRTMLKPIVEFLHSATKSRTVMPRCERFKLKFGREVFARHYLPVFFL